MRVEANNSANQSNQLDAYGKQCFRRMLDREEELGEDFCVFYHSYSFIALLYEVQACLACCALRLSPGLAPLPRLLKAPFDGKPCLQLLMVPL